ncbi:hypothetical protein DVA81_19040, partial [Acinetobacter baumannii]
FQISDIFQPLNSALETSGTDVTFCQLGERNIQEDNKMGSKMQGTLPTAVAEPERSMGGFFLLKPS